MNNIFRKFMENSKNDDAKRVIEKYQKNSDEGKALVAEATALMTRYAIQFGDLTGLGNEHNKEINEISNLITRTVGCCARYQALSDEILVMSIENMERTERIEKELEKMNDNIMKKLDYMMTLQDEKKDDKK